MGVLGTVPKYDHRYRFVVEIDDFTSFKFMTCSDLKASLGEVVVKEGGTMVPHKEPGTMTFDDITLERGVTTNQEVYEWFKQTANAVKDTGLASPDYLRNLDIVQLDRDGSELKRWTCEQCWPKEFTAGSWDNDAEEAVVETLVISINKFKRPTD